MKPDVVVVGAGVIGCAIAYELASRHGVKVQVVDRGPPGGGASSAAAGMLGAQVETRDARPAVREALIRLAVASRFAHATLDERLRAHGIEGSGLRQCGLVHVAFDEAERDKLVASYAWQRERGLRVETLSGEEARRLEPMLSDRVVGAVHLPYEARVEPPRFVAALVVAARMNDVEFREGTHVLRVKSTGGRVRGIEIAGGETLEAGAIVIAAGCFTSLLEGAPTELRRVRPIRGQIVRLRTRSRSTGRVLVTAGSYLVPRCNGDVLIGSTMEDAGFDRAVTASGVRGLLERAIAISPSLADASLVDAWSGLRPRAEEDRPMIGATSIEGLFVATGHHRSGILLAPETARLLADRIATGEHPRDLDAFDPSREAPSATS